MSIYRLIVQFTEHLSYIDGQMESIVDGTALHIATYADVL